MDQYSLRYLIFLGFQADRSIYSKEIIKDAQKFWVKDVHFNIIYNGENWNHPRENWKTKLQLADY